MVRYIEAKQIIYTRVEHAYAPEGKAGWHNVFTSRDISQHDVDYVKSLTLCYEAITETSPRIQYFTLPSGNAVITYTAILNDKHPKYQHYIDAYSRPSIPIIHSIIIGKNDLEILHYCPWSTISSIPFIQDLDKFIRVIESYTESYKDAPTLKITIEPEKTPKLGWDPHELSKLYTIAAQADLISQLSKWVCFTGSIDNFWRTLSDISWILEPHQRSSLTFTTTADECFHKWKTGSFWGLYFEKLERSSSFVAVVNTDTRTVTNLSKEIPLPEDCYSKWVFAQLEIGNGEGVVTHAPVIQTLASAIDHSMPIESDWLTQQSETLIETFIQANEQYIFDCLVSTCANSLRLKEDTLRLFAEYLLTNKPLKWIVEFASYHDVSPQSVLNDFIDWMYTLSTDQLNRFSGEDWYYLLEISKRTESQLIVQFWAFALLPTPDVSTLQQLSGKVRLQDYKRLLSRIYDPLKPHWLVPSSPSANTKFLVQNQKLTQISYDELYKLVESLLISGNGNYLKALANLALLNNMEYSQTKAMYELLKRHPKGSKSFQKVISSTLQNSNQGKKFFRKFVTRWKRAERDILDERESMESEKDLFEEENEIVTKKGAPYKNELVPHHEEYISQADESEEKEDTIDKDDTVVQADTNLVSIQPNPTTPHRPPNDPYGRNVFKSSDSSEFAQKDRGNLYDTPLPIADPYAELVDRAQANSEDSNDKRRTSPVDYLGVNFSEEQTDDKQDESQEIDWIHPITPDDENDDKSE